MNAIDFPSNNVGYIVGEDTTLLKSIDGGQTWQELPTTGINITTGFDDNFTDIDFVDENVGFLVAGYSGIYATTDGGQTWSIVSGQTSNMCFPQVVYPFSQDHYFAGGAGCFQGAIIDKYQSGTWTTGTLANTFWDTQETVVEMSFRGNTRGLAATRSEYMLRTVDGGITWDTVSTNIMGDLTAVVMVNDTLCYAGYDENGGGFGLLRSIDGGLTWEQDVNSATFFYPAFLSVHAANNGDVYSGAAPSFGGGGLIFETTDGTNWMYQSVDQPINDLASYWDDVTFGVGDSGYLVVNTPLSNLGIQHHSELQFECYPNPVSKQLIIRNPTGEGEVSIRDANGRLLQTQGMNAEMETIDCSHLCAGVYFVVIQQNDQIGVKKFIKE